MGRIILYPDVQRLMNKILKRNAIRKEERRYTTNRRRVDVMKEAMFYESTFENRVRCKLCNNRCKIQEGKRGICGVRENQAGRLYSLVYGKIIAEHIDPIEKKPLFNFLPGSRAFRAFRRVVFIPQFH